MQLSVYTDYISGRMSGCSNNVIMKKKKIIRSEEGLLFNTGISSRDLSRLHQRATIILRPFLSSERGVLFIPKVSLWY